MERVLIAVIMAIICFIIGMIASTTLKMRVVQLRKLITMLDEMSVLIQFRALKTRELIKEISEHDCLGSFIFLDILSECLEFESDINIGWKTAVKQTAFLNSSDKDIMLSVGDQIGTTDINGQISMLELNKNLAERNLYQAEEEYRIKGKMLRTVWCLCGLAAGIMIL